jgi:hypothetical protein
MLQSLPDAPRREDAQDIPAETDRPLGARILDQLELSGVPDFMSLRISVERGVVTLMGEISTVYEKRLVIQACERVAGVVEVVDRTSLRPVPRDRWNPLRRFFPQDDGYEYVLPYGRKHAVAIAVLLVLAGAWATQAPADRFPVYPVTGKVIVEGDFPAGATVVLHPVDSSRTIRPRGVVGVDGTFSVTTYLPADGAPAGEYKVTVAWNKPVRNRHGELVAGPGLTPRAYTHPETTPFAVTVRSGDNELSPLQITK